MSAKRIKSVSKKFGYPDNKRDKDIDDTIEKIQNIRWEGDEEEGKLVATDAIWEEVLEKYPEWGTVNYLYIKFIKGDLYSSPLHLGPLNLDTQKQGVKDLITINRLGFQTVDSQPGVCTDFVNPFNKRSGKERQRQYVVGYLPCIYLEKFLRNLGEYDVAYDVFDGHGNRIVEHFPEWTREKHDNLDFGRYNDDVLPLTISKFDDEDMWTVETKMSMHGTPFDSSDDFGPFYVTKFDGFPKIEAFHKWIVDNTVFIEIVAREFCKPNILDKILIDSLTENF